MRTARLSGRCCFACGVVFHGRVSYCTPAADGALTACVAAPAGLLLTCCTDHGRYVVLRFLLRYRDDVPEGRFVVSFSLRRSVSTWRTLDGHC